jgi:hypothetical protein
MNDEALTPDAVEPAPDDVPDTRTETIGHPAKLIRIASMTRAMLDEVRRADVDDAGRRRLAEVHRQSVEELREVLSDDLLSEFDQVMLPLDDDSASAAEIRLAQAQLIGWLEGLFHGIQATLFSQQVAAQSQLAELQRRALQRPRPDSDGGGLYL